jgi:hypothetical protein
MAIKVVAPAGSSFIHLATASPRGLANLAIKPPTLAPTAAKPGAAGSAG